MPHDPSSTVLEVVRRADPSCCISSLGVDLLCGDCPSPPRAAPRIPFSEVAPLLDLLALLSKTAPIGCSPTFSQRVRAQLCAAEDIGAADSRALATDYKCPPLCDFSTRQLAFRLAGGDVRGSLAAVARELGVALQLPTDHPDAVRVHVHRDSVFSDGCTVMRLLTSPHVRLDVSFFGEEGIGHGPTHEFFTLFSRELCRTERRLFRSDSRTTVYAKSPAGLFFAPDAPPAGVAVLGTFLAKALQMGCLVDMNLNPALFAFVRGGCVTVAEVDQALARSLAEPGGCVGLPFVYPGLALPLLEGGATVEVTAETVGEWVALVADFTCGAALAPIREAFLEGFERVMPFWALDVFEPREICALLRGDGARFGVEELRENVIVSHGFLPGSPTVERLFEVIAEFSVEEQRLLVQFITGYAQLPIGGLAALEPKLTVAQRNEVEPDKLLPSVMTCKNYFKVPAYSSKQIMRERILTAYSEGQGSVVMT
jgi:E3 ubiquitin-protein ligase TRIP12